MAFMRSRVRPPSAPHQESPVRIGKTGDLLFQRFLDFGNSANIDAKSQSLLRSGRPLDECVQVFGKLILKRWYYVRIGVQRHGYRRMAKPFLYDLRMHACSQKERSVGVPQCVKTHLGQAGGFENQVVGS